jgi:3D (Asp-Asp-Asp) domain-containing protein
MPKSASFWTIAVLGFIICWAVTARAQDAAPAKNNDEAKASAQAKSDAEAAARREEKPIHAYRLDFSVNELEEGKTINTRQYSMNLQADDANEIKIGTRVPVETGQGQFQYMDVGTSIWCRIGERAEGIPLSVRAEISNFAIPEQSTGHEAHPVIRQLQIKASTLAQLSKPMIVGSEDDPNSKRQFQLVVTVTRLK